MIASPTAGAFVPWLWSFFAILGAGLSTSLVLTAQRAERREDSFGGLGWTAASGSSVGRRVPATMGIRNGRRRSGR